MLRALKAVFATGICLLSAGCYRTVLNTPAHRSNIENDATGISWISMTPVTHNATECARGIAKVDAQMPAWGAFVWFLTGGVIAPMTIEYYCVEPPSGSQAMLRANTTEVRQ